MPNMRISLHSVHFILSFACVFSKQFCLSAAFLIGNWIFQLFLCIFGCHSSLYKLGCKRIHDSCSESDRLFTFRVRNNEEVCDFSHEIEYLAPPIHQMIE